MNKSYLLVCCTIWILNVALVSPTPAPVKEKTPTPAKEKTTPAAKEKTTPAPKAEKYSCQQCIAKGTDCKGSASGKICDYCTKIVAKVDSSTETPLWATAILAAVKPGVKASDHNGELVTLKLCVTKASIEKAGYSAIASCGAFEQMGLKGYGCTCEGECKEPNSPNAPKDAPPTDAN